MAGTIAEPLSMSDERLLALKAIARSTSLPHRTVVQAKALLLAGDGLATNEVARRCDTSADSVRAWRRRFAEQGVEGVGRIAHGRGRRSWVPEGTVEAVVHDTKKVKPDDGSTHWTTRSMAKRFGIGKDTVVRIWRDHNLKPWKVKTFKISNDSNFEEKLVDVVGRYMNPPERAVVFSFDEKTRCQALDRTQVADWLAHPKRDRWHLHFTPTSSSWLNLVECWFSLLTARRLKRGVFISVDELVEAIEVSFEHWNDDLKPFIWKMTAEDIMARVARGRATLNARTESATNLWRIS